ncbi:hypothetical protein MFLO_16115 [Listeria floridensis FSL S10-1187]|uniref:Uncharacterized protein n=1 Tax=Listeria floridensis FSL S10-1187 TaxID=1265817 RepID=A0ABN0RB37_9LIST|nr:hypothetical protein [Listeria floridensis]EUJ23261.1 hypothetical protein MFLO_16115 [Listeria floridensis FSL S10-1187]
MKPRELRELTPRDFYLLMSEEEEYRYDQIEEQVRQAIFNESAARSKKLKPESLFKRPTEEDRREKVMSEDEKLIIQRENENFLSKIDFSKLQKGG